MEFSTTRAPLSRGLARLASSPHMIIVPTHSRGLTLRCGRAEEGRGLPRSVPVFAPRPWDIHNFTSTSVRCDGGRLAHHALTTQADEGTKATPSLPPSLPLRVQRRFPFPASARGSRSIDTSPRPGISTQQRPPVRVRVRVHERLPLCPALGLPRAYRRRALGRRHLFNAPLSPGV